MVSGVKLIVDTGQPMQWPARHRTVTRIHRTVLGNTWDCVPEPIAFNRKGNLWHHQPNSMGGEERGGASILHGLFAWWSHCSLPGPQSEAEFWHIHCCPWSTSPFSVLRSLFLSYLFLSFFLPLFIYFCPRMNFAEKLLLEWLGVNFHS